MCELLIILRIVSLSVIKHKISQTRKAINALNSIWWHKNITKEEITYLSNNNSEHFDVWCRGMANPYQGNK
jgi:hypothetical protein